MAYSFSTEDVDMADYGLTVMSMELPVAGEPFTETVNLIARVGGYTYTNEVKPANLVLGCLVTAADNSTLYTYLEAIADALPALTEVEIHIDGQSRYWIGKRISGIQASIYGAALNVAEFEIVFVCDDPTSEDELEGT